MQITPYSVVSHRPLPQAVAVPQDSLPQEPLDEFRSIDGSGNNLQHPDWGRAGQSFPRILPSAYADGVAAPNGGDRANPRTVSENVLAQRGRDQDAAGRSNMVWAWGQFLDHDLSFTPAGHVPDLSIPVPPGDPHFDPNGEGKAIIPFSRSIAAPGTGTDPSRPREQMNAITNWIDGSMVYGSDPVRAAALRTFEGGRLKVEQTEHGDFLPHNTLGLDNDNPMRKPAESLLVAGDVRANENLGLLALHTVFLREHNRLCDEIAKENPGLSDEQIYLRARRVVGAQIQAITYNEFLPSLLGEDALPKYEGYKPEVDPRVSNLFATAAYRMGHSQVEPIIWRSDADGNAIPERDLALLNAYFSPERLQEGGIEPLLRGLTQFIQEPTDEKISGQLRNLLFGRPGKGGMDLGALNIQRGRDHGLPDYNTVRAAFGQKPISDFAELTSDPVKLENLRKTYPDVNSVDSWVGLLAEEPAPGAAVGPTLKAILADQFTRLRDGDRFWYENDPALADQVESLRDLSVADVIRRNTTIGEEMDDTPFTAEQFRRRRSA
jgi:peroxidase